MRQGIVILEALILAIDNPYCPMAALTDRHHDVVECQDLHPRGTFLGRPSGNAPEIVLQKLGIEERVVEDHSQPLPVLSLADQPQVEENDGVV